MNLKAMKEQLNDLVAQKKSLLTSAIEECRSLDDAQTEELRSIDVEIENLKAQITKTEEEQRSNVEKQELKGSNNMKDLELRSIEKFIKTGNIDEEIRATTTGAMNSAIQPVYVQDEIVRRLEEVAPVFAKAKLYQATAGELKIPREDKANLWEYGFVGEDADVTEQSFKFDTISLKQVRVGASVKITQQLLNDADLDIVSYVVEMLSRRLGATLDHHALTGNGTQGSDLQGLVNLTKATHGITELTESVAVTADTLIDAIHGLHPSLLDGAEFYMNRKNFNAIAKLKDASGQYILKMERSLAVEAPHYTIMGFKVNVSQDMPDNRILFVNVGRACASMIKKGSQLIRISNDTQNALRGTHTFVIDAYVDFRLRDPQAVVLVKIGA